MMTASTFGLVAMLATLAQVMCNVPEPFANGKHIYYGHYPGKCGNDGFYYNDEASFVICSNNNAYVMKCPLGTVNGGPKSFFNGFPYAHGDFCQKNLNDFGYVPHPRPAYVPDHYAAPAHPAY